MPRRLKQERQHSTHFIPDCHTKANMTYLTHLDRLTTLGMGGILPEQPDPTLFRHVLDIGCGPGSWAIDAAQLYPTMSLVGIDIDSYTVNYARMQAEASRVGCRVKFRCMDALRALEFPDTSFDLVNLRLGGSFIRTWDWPNVLKEIARVTRPGGSIRIVEFKMITDSSSAALLQIGHMLACSFFHAGHFFEPKPPGLTDHLEGLLKVHGFRQLQTKLTIAMARAETEPGKKVLEHAIRSFPSMRFFIQKWSGSDIKEYDCLCHQVLVDMQQNNFHAAGHFVTFWGIK